MAFRLSNAAREYFDSIEKTSSTGGFESMWDKYYFAAMVGIKARDREVIDDEPTADPFITAVIGDYQDQKYEIYAALITAEIDRQNIPQDAEDEIRGLMLGILDSSDPTQLSDKGKKLLNCYAERGHKRLRDAGPVPAGFDEFLRKYHQVIEQA